MGRTAPEFRSSIRQQNKAIIEKNNAQFDCTTSSAHPLLINAQKAPTTFMKTRN
jgi:hypothetical protein